MGDRCERCWRILPTVWNGIGSVCLGHEDEDRIAALESENEQQKERHKRAVLDLTGLAGDYREEMLEWKARAEAAESALATASIDGARELVEWYFTDGGRGSDVFARWLASREGE